MKKIPITFDSDEWELIVRTLDKAYPERPPPGSPEARLATDGSFPAPPRKAR